LQQSGARGTVEDITSAISSARDTLRSKSLDNQLQLIDQFRSGQRYESLVSGNREATDRFDSVYNHAKSLSDSAMAEFRESDQYREYASKAAAFSRSFNLNYAREFNDYLRMQNKLGVTGSDLKLEAAKFIASGDLVDDGTGRTTWVSRFSDGGLTPSSFSDRQSSLDKYSYQSSSISQDAALETSRSANTSRVRSLQRSQGLSPNSLPSGSAISTAAVDSEQDISRRVSSNKSEINASSRDSQLADRAKSLSVFQIDGPNGNQAIQALENETGVKVENLDQKLQRSQEWKKDAWPNKKK
jgi:hypothetical protein